MVDFKELTEELRMKRGYCLIPLPPPKPIKGIRTNSVTGEEREVIIGYEIRENTKKDGREAFWLIGGPTGYESFLVEPDRGKYWDDMMEWITTRGWNACAGTPGRWDRLWISPEEMLRVLKDEGFI
jgi:hypothetical protein